MCARVLLLMTYPDKPASTSLPVVDAIQDRWSPFAFSEQPIEEEKLRTIFEAARWAPSSYNEQPWRYVYATKDDGAMREAMESLLVEGNSWAKHAYLLIVSFASAHLARNGNENRFAMHDLGAANSNIAMQLPSLGLVGHQMGGFDALRSNEVLGVPSEYVPGSMIAIGYPGDVSDLSEDLRKRHDAQRIRKEQSEFVFHGKWEGNGMP